jgi:hypothetical protein
MKVSYYILRTPAGVKRHVVPRTSKRNDPKICPAVRGVVGPVRPVCPLVEELRQHVRQGLPMRTNSTNMGLRKRLHLLLSHNCKKMKYKVTHNFEAFPKHFYNFYNISRNFESTSTISKVFLQFLKYLYIFQSISKHFQSISIITKVLDFLN